MFYCKKILYAIVVICSLVACKDTTDTPPFNFRYMVRLIDEDGSSSLQKNQNRINEITVNLLEPYNAEIVNLVYLESYDYLDIQVQEWSPNIKDDIEDYMIEMQYPKDIRSKKDTLRVRYQFNGTQPYIINAFYNDIEPQYMRTEIIVFELENK